MPNSLCNSMFKPIPPAGAQSGSRPVILCVDDEPMVLESLREQLRGAFGNQYYYEIAQDADDALEVLQELQADQIEVVLIVSDWLMPGMKGDEFLVKVHQNFPNVVKVLLTGQADEAAILRAREQANLHRCLLKPWSEAELIQAIRSGLWPPDPAAPDPTPPDSN